MTETTKSTEQLVDEFTKSTWGECDPECYRQKMVEFFGKALKDAHIAGQEFANDNR